MTKNKSKQKKVTKASNSSKQRLSSEEQIFLDFEQGSDAEEDDESDEEDSGEEDINEEDSDEEKSDEEESDEEESEEEQSEEEDSDEVLLRYTSVQIVCIHHVTFRTILKMKLWKK